jgi:hypothetical protein
MLESIVLAKYLYQAMALSLKFALSMDFLLKFWIGYGFLTGKKKPEEGFP